ncbi:MAG: 50S ribosomal protein L18 [Candidatus Gastranaerophilales bacterium]|jgi:large subunit ribosomal protein L18|nr:50S ribosomal protein L18 [Candidatus Gastranaerophilales bacterium]
MIKSHNKKALVQKKHRRIRNKISGTSECPRLAVHKSGKHIYAQIIDDSKGLTLASASSVSLKSDKIADTEVAKAVGLELAKAAKKAKVQDVVFDRGGFVYHGKIAALADAAREGGLNF